MQHKTITENIAVAATLGGWRFAVCLFLSALLSTGRLDAMEPLSHDVGIVLKLKGKWLLNAKAVVAGQLLPAGKKIYHPQMEPGEPESMDYILIVFFDGKIESRSWDDPTHWNSPIQLPPSPTEPPSRWNQIVNAVMGVFPGHPEKYTQMSVRSPAVDLEDAVVDLNNGQLDLTPAFKNLKEGQYFIVFERMQLTNRRSEEVSRPVPFDWNQTTKSPLTIPGIQPGLYALRLQDKQPRDTPITRPEAWILILPGAQFENAAKAFQECTALTKQWVTKAPADVRRSFCRAYLDSFAVDQNQ